MVGRNEIQMQHQMKWKCSLKRKLDLWSCDAKEWRIKSHV